MISEWELWAAANPVIKQHGDMAALYAAGRADDQLDQVDMEGSGSGCGS